MPSDTDQAVADAFARKELTLRLVGLAFPAIRTRYRGPTECRRSRIIATMYDTRYTIGYDDAKSPGRNHAEAAYGCWQRHRTAARETLGFDDEPRVFIPADTHTEGYTYTVVPSSCLA